MEHTEKCAGPLGQIRRKTADRYALEQDYLRLARQVEKAMGHQGNTLLITSAGSVRGRADTALHLAEALAQRQRRVLLLDADVAVPGLQAYFADQEAPVRPLEQYLEDTCRERDIVGFDSSRSLYYIVGQCLSEKISEKALTRLRELIQACGRVMDYVIVNGPGMNRNGLAEELAADCDASLLVTGKRALKQAAVRDAQAELMEMSGNYLGYVINGLRSPKTKHRRLSQPELSLRLKTLHHGFHRSIKKQLWVLPAVLLLFGWIGFLAAAFICHETGMKNGICPWTGLFMGAGIGLSVWLAAGAFAAAEERTICTSAQVRGYLGVRCLCELPGGRLRRRKTMIRYRAALETTAKKLEKLKRENRVGGHVIMVTETREGEGKSTLAWNLAELLSEKGEQVILVDADLHHTILSQWLINQKNETIEWDLLDVLESRALLEEAILHGSFGFLGMKQSLRQPYPFLRMAAMRQIFSQLREQASYIIIDAPPMSGAEAECIAEQADSILYAIQHDHTKLNCIIEGLEQLRSWEKEVSGAIICRSVH